MDYTVAVDEVEQVPPSESSIASADDLEWLSCTKPLGKDRKVVARTSSGAPITIHCAGNTPGEGPSAF